MQKIFLLALTLLAAAPMLAKQCAPTHASAEVRHEPVVHHIKTQKELDQLLAKTPGALVDFSTGWCGACKAAKPKYQKLAQQYSHNITFIAFEHADRGEAATITRNYKVSGYPTFIIFNNGIESKRLIGYKEADLEQAVVSLDAAIEKSKVVAQAPAPVKSEAKAKKNDNDAQATTAELIDMIEKQEKKLAQADATKAKTEEKQTATVKELKSFAEFKELVEKSGKPVVVKFYANWCPHCITNASVYAALAQELGARAIVAQMEEATMKTCIKELDELQITGYPTFFVFHSSLASYHKVHNDKPEVFKTNIKTAVATKPEPKKEATPTQAAHKTAAPIVKKGATPQQIPTKKDSAVGA